MDYLRMSRCLATMGLALAWSATSHAAAVSSGAAVSPLFQTGNVETDMPSSAANSSITTIAGHPFNYTYQPQWMTDQGLVNGYAMKDIRLSYDKSTDTLAVGVNFFGVAGNTDGSPDGKVNPMTVATHGSNPANFGADKSIAVAFTPVTAAGQPAANPLIIAGVPAVKDASTTTTDHFTVAAYQASTGGLAHSFGQTLTSNVGNLAYNPSSAHPDFEFTIKNFSKIPGLNALTNGFYLSAFSGAQQTVIVGKSDIASTFVAAPALSQGNLNPTPVITPPTIIPMQPPAVPEPTTILAWGLIASGAAWRFRRRNQPQS